MEVVVVEASVQRTLAYIYKSRTDTTRSAIAGLELFINLIEPVCEMLGRNYRSFELTGKSSFQTRMHRTADGDRMW